MSEFLYHHLFKYLLFDIFLSVNSMLPFVSVLCPTYDRHDLFATLVDQYRNQDYPAKRRELIILDDSPRKSYELENIEREVKYVHINPKMTIGQKRNWLLKKAKGEIIVWMDDDDLYMKDRITKSVHILNSLPVDIIGVKSTVFYDVDSQRFAVVKHKTENYTCNNILAHRKSLRRSYSDEDAISEEKYFTDMFKLKAYQFAGIDLCIHICHGNNTASKRQFFRNLAQPIDLNKIKSKYDWDLLKKIESILKMNTNMKNIFWINLKKDTDRREFMEREFLKIEKNFKAFRFEALSPSTLEKDRYICSSESSHKSSEEEICCMSSHVDLIKLAFGNLKDEIYVMEDDMVIKADSFKKLDEVMKTAPTDWEVLQLHHIRLDCRRKQLSYDGIINGNWVPWRRGYYSTGFYVIRKSALAKFLHIFYDHTAGKFNYQSVIGPIQADNVIFKHLRTYTSVHNFVSTNLRFKSNIQKTDRNNIVRDFERNSSSCFRV